MTISFCLIFNVIFLALLVMSICVAYRVAKQFSFRELHRDRRGVSYSLTMVITLPFYLAMVLGGIELSWLFYTNLRFQRAVMMAGRSVAVCYQQEFEEHDQNASEVKKALEQTGELSAAAVLLSAGSGLEDHELTLSQEESEFVKQLLKHLGATTNFAPNSDTQRRANYAVGATTVEFELLPNQVNSGKQSHQDRAELKVTYEHPFFSQVIGRVFGQSSTVGNGFFVRKLEKTVEIPLEIARSKDGTMGIK